MGNNPLTTTAGGGAIAAALIGIIQMIASGHIDIQSLVTDIGVLLAGVVGLFAKDHNVTGGTKPQ